MKMYLFHTGGYGVTYTTVALTVELAREQVRKFLIERAEGKRPELVAPRGGFDQEWYHSCLQEDLKELTKLQVNVANVGDVWQSEIA